MHNPHGKWNWFQCMQFNIYGSVCISWNVLRQINRKTHKNVLSCCILLDSILRTVYLAGKRYSAGVFQENLSTFEQIKVKWKTLPRQQQFIQLHRKRGSVCILGPKWLYYLWYHVLSKTCIYFHECARQNPTVEKYTRQKHSTMYPLCWEYKMYNSVWLE